MIEQLIHKALNTFTKEVVEENSYTPRVRVQSTVDEGAHLTNIERQIHIFNEIKKQ